MNIDLYQNWFIDSQRKLTKALEMGHQVVFVDECLFTRKSVYNVAFSKPY